jgi:DNA-binding SARP family transcriptional activator/Tfp pilus assembly protein PilF
LPVEFRVLGPVEVVDGGRTLRFGPRKLRVLLGVLLGHANQGVARDVLVGALWSKPPRTAAENLRVHVYHLRRELGAERVVRRYDGYLLVVKAGELDCDTFTDRVEQAGLLLAAGDADGAGRTLQAALGMWRGPAFGDLRDLDLLRARAEHLEEQRLDAVMQRIDADLILGRHQQIAGEVAQLAAEHPLREGLQARLLLALYRSGRIAEALQAFDRCRRWLYSELGVEPGAELQAVHLAILREDPQLMPGSLRAVAAGPAAPRPGHDGIESPIPRQLPGDVAGFTGRGAELARLDALLPAGTDNGSDLGADTAAREVVILAIAGTAGVGKTALAVRWAHRVSGRFPDGQLYVDLRGYDPGQPMTAAEALARFLGVLGVAGRDTPLEVEELAARYRSEIAGRRMLIVLDNAATVEQVRPLLPGTSSCAVVVTSRDSLAGLVAVHGAHRLDLDLLPAGDAYALLRRLIGPRVDAHPEATAALAGQCTRLPLALRVAAELATSRPAIALADLVADLADQQRRMDLLDAGGDPRAAVTAVFSWSLRHLPAGAAGMFRLLGLHPGPDLDPYAAAALADTSLQQARRSLDALTRAHLLHPTAGGRYGMHDLLRTYAASLATAEDSDTGRTAALGRLFDYYLATAAAAMDMLYPAQADRRPRIPPAATPTPDLADPDAARRWLDTERHCLVAIAAHTAAHGWPTHTVRLSTTLYRYLVGGHHTDALAIYGHARGAAERSGDQVGQAHVLLGLGTAHAQLAQYRPAAGHLEQALVLFRHAGDQVGEARALGNLGGVEQALGCFRSAADHHQQALALFRQVGDRIGEAYELDNLGAVEQLLGRFRSAAGHHQQALALCRQAGDHNGEARALDNLGAVEQRLGRYRPAIAHHERALVLFRQLGNRYGEAWALTNLGIVHTRLGGTDRATECHRQALTIFRDIGDRDGQAWALNGLGEAAHPADAITHHTEALTIATDTGTREQQARAHTGLAHAQRTLGHPDQARHHYKHALTLYTDLGSPEADQISTHLTAAQAASANSDPPPSAP